MYLKHLEMYGFKTFAQRTTLEFGRGITAVVGPNGSGKTNLSDAILWCLGEQSFKSLRSGSSQDIIFAGGAERRRGGVAEASITLDNSDGALPLDFSEITITRRVFRTGQSEFFINRVPCRLRDIHELLLDTGIGKSAYSVISQNEVDRILSVRSEDRREIFEQAAGIQRYRQRRHEAKRKLDKVCANLLRVNDIIHELEIQVAPLSQQCESARAYQAVSKELFDLKLSVLVSDHSALSASLSRAREREREMEEEVEGARTRSHQLAAEEAELRGQLTQAEERLEETRGLVARLTGESDRLEGRLELVKQRIAHLNEQARTGAQELSQLEAERAAGEKELTASQEERPGMEERQRRLQSEVAEVEQQLREQTDVLRSTGDSGQQSRAEHVESLRRLADARNRLVQCESLLQAAQARISQIAEQQSALEAQRQQTQARAQEAVAAAEQLRLRRQEIEAELYSLRSEEDAARAAAGEREEEEVRLRERLSEVRSRHRALHEIEHAREGLRAGVRAVLAAAEQGRLTGEYRTVAELLTVPKELERAVEAALGPALGDLVVPEAEQAAAAIAFLKETKGGRATFLPTARITPTPRPAHLAELARRPGCLGVGADLVECDPSARPVLEHLLGRVLIMEELEGALALSRDSKGWRAIVTRDGDVIRPWGSITGGSPAATPRLLGRAREIGELGAEQEKLEAALARVTEEIRQAEERAASARAACDARNEDVSSTLAALNESEQTCQVLKESGRAEQERWDSLASEREALEKEVGQIEQERAEAGALVESVEQRQVTAETATAELDEDLRQRREAREQLAAIASERKVALSTVEGDLRALDVTIEKTRQNLQTLSAGIAEKQALIERAKAGEQQARAELEQLTEQRGRVEAQRTQADAELTRVRDQRQKILDQLASNREADARVKEEIESLQARIHRSQLRTTQLDSELGFTERTLMDEYRISLEEAEKKAEPVENRTHAQARLKELQAALDGLGEVNLGAVEEYDRVQKRLEFLGGQRTDLEGAKSDLEQVIVDTDREATSRFLSAFELLGKQFSEMFVRLFGGGEAVLVLTDPRNVLECGVDVTVTVPGKKTRDLLQLSGGERALTAAALLFALLRVKPPPFVILDEVDAPLDDSNIGRYCQVLRDFARQSQFIVITHNKGTMEAADTLYGVTMEEAGVSRLIGMHLRDAAEMAAVPRPVEPEAREAGEKSEEAA